MNESLSLPADALLERFLLGELPRHRLQEIRRRLDIDPALRDRIEAMSISNRSILELYPAEDMVRKIRAYGSRKETAAKPREGGRRPSFHKTATALLRIRLAAPAFAVFAALVFMIYPGREHAVPPPQDGGETVRLKGAEAGMAIYRKTRSGSELLPPQAMARAGDTLQIFYHTRQQLYGVLFSLDGRGAITLHFPESEGPAAVLESGSFHPAPHAFRLDRAPLLERFFLVTSPSPFSTDHILLRLRKEFPAGSSVPETLPGLEAGFRQYSYTIRKAGKFDRKAKQGGFP